MTEPTRSPEEPAESARVLAEPLRSRWSPSVFDERHILDAGEITTLLTAARWAPSLGNSQPWRFVVAPRGSAGHTAFLPHLRRGNAGWVPRASLVLVAGCEVVDVASLEHACYDLGQAAAHVSLQARATGLDAHQFAGFDKDAAAAALGVPDHVRLMSGIAIGLHRDPDPSRELQEPDLLRDLVRDREREQRPRGRRPLAETAYDGHWGRPWAP